MAAQARVQSAKQDFQKAFDQVVKEKGRAEGGYNEEKEAGLIGDQSFDQWAQSNASAPAYVQSRYLYQQTRAAYEAALQAIGGSELETWQEKVREKAKENPLPNGLPNNNVLIGPE
ncbi:hypothetical protein ACHAPT_013089 [Fusarium lateritium]